MHSISKSNDNTLKTAKIKKNGDNSFAAVDISATCCKSVITMFISSAVFGVSLRR